MMRFLARRALWLLLTVWTVMSVSFFLVRAVPGGPFSQERRLPLAVEGSIDTAYHPDWPLWRQYLHYVGPFNFDRRGLLGERTKIFGGVLAADLGPSFRYRDFSVNEILRQSLPISLRLGLLALSWALAVGLSVGWVSALRAGSRLDHGVRAVAVLGLALPNFVIAGLLLLVFAFTLDWLPPAGTDSLAHLVLPSLALGAPFAAHVTRLTRTGLLEVLSQDFIRMAHAKGVPPATLVLRHALKAGLLPVVSYLGPVSAGILTGSLVIERIFAIPGTGWQFVTSALNRDYALALGVAILYSVLVYALNTVVDLAHTWLDPRISLEEL